MKRKKGFTLIELLAVIVILAIIALIAVPVVMNIIEKAQKSAFEDSAYGILKAGELYYSEQEMSLNEMQEEKVFTFPNDIEGLEINRIELMSGAMAINENGEIALAITNGKHCVMKKYNTYDIMITNDILNCRNPEIPILSQLAKNNAIIKSVDKTKDEILILPDCIKNKTKCASGTPVAVEVTPGVIYKFYVLNDDTIKNEVTLIMDRNLGTSVTWYKDNDNSANNELNNLGPVTALNYLNEQTKGWENIEIIKNYTYDGETGLNGYQKLEIKNGVGKLISKDGQIETEITGVSKARLLTYAEAKNLGCTSNYYSCKSWLHENLYDTGDTSTYGYWFLTANSDVSNSSYRMHFHGFVNSLDIFYPSGIGIRPVITLSK